MLFEASALLQHTVMSPWPVTESYPTSTYTACPLTGKAPMKRPIPDQLPICFCKTRIDSGRGEVLRANELNDRQNQR